MVGSAWGSGLLQTRTVIVPTWLNQSSEKIHLKKLKLIETFHTEWRIQTKTNQVLNIRAAQSEGIAVPFSAYIHRDVAFSGHDSTKKSRYEHDDVHRIHLSHLSPASQNSSTLSNEFLDHKSRVCAPPFRIQIVGISGPTSSAWTWTCANAV